MITPGYVRMMADYNAWMNDGIYRACGQLGDDDRKKECGAFFGSIQKTLNHVLWGDQIWLHRLAGTPAPISKGISGSTTQFEAFDDLSSERQACDRAIVRWAADVAPEALEGNLTWFSSVTNGEISKPRSQLVVHMFNHQTHHRGQVHAMISRLGVVPPVTDLPFLQ